MKKEKKAVSPVVSTVLLIMIVIVLAAIIFVWSRSFIKEAIIKDVGGQEKNVDQICLSGLELKSFVNKDGSFGFTNNGNIPIYGFNLKEVHKVDGSSFTNTSFSMNQISPGKSITIPSSPGNSYSDFSQVEIIPIVLGKNSGGTQQYTCPETNAVIV
jgi:flagellin-like protein